MVFLVIQSCLQVRLKAGQRYYFEALRRETSGPDHLSIGWLQPGQTGMAPAGPIPGLLVGVVSRIVQPHLSVAIHVRPEIYDRGTGLWCAGSTASAASARRLVGHRGNRFRRTGRVVPAAQPVPRDAGTEQQHQGETTADERHGTSRGVESLAPLGRIFQLIWPGLADFRAN